MCLVRLAPLSFTKNAPTEQDDNWASAKLCYQWLPNHLVTPGGPTTTESLVMCNYLIVFLVCACLRTER